MAQDTLEKLVDAIGQHYAQPNPRKLLLSTFGQRNKVLVAELKEHFGSLLEAVRAVGEDRVQLIDTTPGQEAVAPAAIAANLRQQVAEDSASAKQAAASFDTLPPPVQLAFCVRIEPGELIALDTLPPFRFAKVTAPELIRATQRIVEDRFRQPGLALRSASLTERANLWKHFLAWTEETGVDPGSFRRGKVTSALARLIAAQPPEVVGKLVIPGDIAHILLRHS